MLDKIHIKISSISQDYNINTRCEKTQNNKDQLSKINQNRHILNKCQLNAI